MHKLLLRFAALFLLLVSILQAREKDYSTDDYALGFYNLLIAMGEDIEHWQYYSHVKNQSDASAAVLQSLHERTFFHLQTFFWYYLKVLPHDDFKKIAPDCQQTLLKRQNGLKIDYAKGMRACFAEENPVLNQLLMPENAPDLNEKLQIIRAGLKDKNIVSFLKKGPAKTPSLQKEETQAIVDTLLQIKNGKGILPDPQLYRYAYCNPALPDANDGAGKGLRRVFNEHLRLDLMPFIDPSTPYNKEALKKLREKIDLYDLQIFSAAREEFLFELQDRSGKVVKLNLNVGRTDGGLLMVNSEMIGQGGQKKVFRTLVRGRNAKELLQLRATDHKMIVKIPRKDIRYTKVPKDDLLAEVQILQAINNQLKPAERRGLERTITPSIIGNKFEILGHVYYPFSDGNNKKMEKKKKIKMFIDCAYGLETLHNKLRYVHNDIKTDNLMYNEQDGCVLIDFGLASKELNQLHAVGTRGYVPPEKIINFVINRNIIDIRKIPFAKDQVLKGDVFSLAQSYLEIFFGKNFFADCDPHGENSRSSNGSNTRNNLDTVVKVRQCFDQVLADLYSPSSPNSYDDEDFALLRVLAPALSFDPARRPNARELRKSLEALVK